MFGKYLIIGATVVVLNLLLSADNAVVLALTARRLADQAARHRALTLGMTCSFVLRLIVVSLAVVIVSAWPVRAVGAAYLVFLCVRHFAHGQRRASATSGSTHRLRPLSFTQVVAMLAVTDLVFALDSLLVSVAVTRNLWLVGAGVLLGMVGVRLVSGSFLRLLEHFPDLDHVAYALVGWAGARLLVDAARAFAWSVMAVDWRIEISEPVFWVGMALIVGVGCWHAWGKARGRHHHSTHGVRPRLSRV